MTKKEKFLKTHFNDEGYTYIYILPNSFEIKDKLKEDGFLYSPILKWHTPIKPESYEKIPFLQIHWSDVYNFVTANVSEVRQSGVDKITDVINDFCANTQSDYLGSKGDKVSFAAIIDRISLFQTRYGVKSAIKFITENNCEAMWFTTVAVDTNFSEGDKVYITGTIKELQEYKKTKQTVLIRCKLRKV